MTNYSVTLQTMINNIFQNFIIESIMIVYLDDILIFIWILEKYYRTIYRIIEVLAKHKLFLHSKKCEFDKQQIKYLGLVILKDQVKINSIKVARVHDWPTLQSHTKLQVFYDFTNFYQQFIYEFPTIACSLLDLIINNSTQTQIAD